MPNGMDMNLKNVDFSLNTVLAMDGLVEAEELNDSADGTGGHS